MLKPRTRFSKKKQTQMYLPFLVSEGLWKGSNLKKMKARVMVLMHDTLSDGALQMWKFYHILRGFGVTEQTQFFDRK